VAYPLVATRALEATFQLLPDVEGAVSLAANDVVIPFLDRVQSVVIGPGLSQRPGVSAFIRAFLKTCRSREHIPLVIDADALNVLSTQEEWWTLVPPGCVLTPHPGEMARLTGRSVREIQAARVDIARTAAAHWCQTVVLKGAHTIVATPDGRWSMVRVATPTLAIAGAGDVLAGIIGGLLAQGLEPYTAAVVGASVHGFAGLLLEGRIGLAGATHDDVVGVIPEVMTRLQSSRWPSKKIVSAS
jgi:NAD(P)H-hydrate epimerase